MKLRNILLLTFNSFLLTHGLSQDFVYKNFTTTDGLSSSEIYDITQDKNGNLWFATDRGLTRYDGYDFVKYTLDDGLTDIVIFNFYEQPDGKIWCSTFNKKLFYYAPDDNLFCEYPFNSVLEGIPAYVTINDITFDNNEDLFINFKGQLGFIKITKDGIVENELKKFSYPPFGNYKIYLNTKNHQFFTHNNIRASVLQSHYLSMKIDRPTHGYYNLLYKPDKNLMLLTLNKEISIIKTDSGSQKNIINEYNIIISGEYDKEHFWVGLQHGGLKIFNYEGKLKHHFLKEKSVTNIFTDHEGGLWMSTIDSGVFYIKNKYVKNYKLPNKSNNVYRLTKKPDNELFIAYHNGEVYNKKGLKFNFVCKSEDNYQSNVQYYSGSNKLLIYTQPDFREITEDGKLKNIDFLNVGYLLSDNTTKPPLVGKFNFIKLDSKRDTLIIPVQKTSGRIHDIDYSADGYYIATIKGLFEFKNDSLHDIREENNLFYQRLEDIDQFKEYHYIASMGAGLIIKGKDTVFNIDISKGLTSNLTSQVYIENENEIYVTSNLGFNRILFKDKITNYTISGFSIADGLPSNEVNDIEIINDTIWLATKDGLSSLPKSIIQSDSTNNIKDWLKIEKIEVDEKVIKDTEQLKRLDYKENSIEISYKAISFKNENDITYRYKLIGLETDWNTTKNRKIRYPELPPGNYTFELQTKLSNKEWNLDSQYVSFKIEPPYWQKWWFNLSIFIIILGIIYSFFRFKILLYNKEIILELLRLILKKLKGKTNHIIIKNSGQDMKLDTSSIMYIKSSGNYLELFTGKKNYLIRGKIGEFEKQLPDKLEFVRIHRSYMIRIDKVKSKSSKSVQINNENIPVGKTYKKNLDRIIF